MTIKSYSVKGNMIRVVDSELSDVFVYPIDRFGSRAELQREIDRKIRLTNRKNTRKTGRIQRLRGELNARN